MTGKVINVPGNGTAPSSDGSIFFKQASEESDLKTKLTYLAHGEEYRFTDRALNVEAKPFDV